MDQQKSRIQQAATKRSKSETFLTLNSLWLGSYTTTSSSTKGSGSKRSSSASTRNFSSLFKRANSSTIVSSINNYTKRANHKENKNFLGVSKSNCEDKKYKDFSFRNIFRSKSSQLNKSQLGIEILNNNFSINKLPFNSQRTSLETPLPTFNKTKNNKLLNYSMSNSSSVSSTNSTPSVLNQTVSNHRIQGQNANKTVKTPTVSSPFNLSFIKTRANADHLISNKSISTAIAKKSTSDPNVYKIKPNSQRLNSDILLKIPNEFVLNDSKKSNVNQSIGSVSNNTDDDFDKAFNEFKKIENPNFTVEPNKAPVINQISNGNSFLKI